VRKVPQRQVEELAVRAACDYDEFYRQRVCPPEATDHLLILSFDGKASRYGLRDQSDKATERPRPANKRVWASIAHTTTGHRRCVRRSAWSACPVDACSRACELRFARFTSSQAEPSSERSWEISDYWPGTSRTEINGWNWHQLFASSHVRGRSTMSGR